MLVCLATPPGGHSDELRGRKVPATCDSAALLAGVTTSAPAAAAAAAAAAGCCWLLLGGELARARGILFVQGAPIRPDSTGRLHIRR